MRQQNSLGHAIDEEKKASSLGAGQVGGVQLNPALPQSIFYYDALGNIARVITQPEVFSSVGQIDEIQLNLTQAVSTTYTYDAYGQLIETHQTVEHPQDSLLPPLFDEELPEAAQPMSPADHGGLAHNAMGFFSQPVVEQGDEKIAPGAQPSATP